MRPASELDQRQDYPSFPEFKQFGIPLDRVGARLVLAIQRFRDVSGIALIPSPVIAGWARNTGSANSQHWALGRLSTAGDLFPARGKALSAWLNAIGMPEFGGVGIYNDTNGPDGRPWVMIHVDLRPESVWWIRDTGRYLYHSTAPDAFWAAIHGIAGIEARLKGAAL